MKMQHLFLAVFIGISSGSAHGQIAPEPGGNASDQALALTNPDEYAWKLFMFLNRPAKAGLPGVADETKKFGDVAPDLPVVWETWALASGRDRSEVYKPDGSRPAKWEDLKRDSRTLVLDVNVENIAVRANSRRAAPAKTGAFVPERPDDQEVRMNKPTFDFIVENEMYNRDGLENILARARSEKNRFKIQLPTGSKEVKTEWRQISEDQKSRYLWRTGTNSEGKENVYGLVAFHVITKDLPNWFWADFGHIDCETAINACSQTNQEPALTNPVDSTTRTSRDTSSDKFPASSGKGGVREETNGTVWSNYILRGTQINFVTPTGSPTILSNPVIENGFQRSSCMTCHARAAVGARLQDASGKPAQQINRLSPGDPELGTPNPALFGDDPGFNQNEIAFIQTDFLWSPVFRAQRKK